MSEIKIPGTRTELMEIFQQYIITNLDLLKEYPIEIFNQFIHDTDTYIREAEWSDWLLLQIATIRKMDTDLLLEVCTLS